jgi:hypothetical protein
MTTSDKNDERRRLLAERQRLIREREDLVIERALLTGSDFQARRAHAERLRRCEEDIVAHRLDVAAYEARFGPFDPP